MRTAMCPHLAGTVDPYGFPEDGYEAEQTAPGLGYAFAASSFSTLGLSVQNGLNETIALRDWKINRSIARIAGDPAALANVERHYETSGELRIPLVMMHTTGDPIQTFWLQQPVYRLKVISTGKWPLFSGIPISRYGHCAFQPGELLLGFVALVVKVEGRELLASR